MQANEARRDEEKTQQHRMNDERQRTTPNGSEIKVRQKKNSPQTSKQISKETENRTKLFAKMSKQQQQQQNVYVGEKGGKRQKVDCQARMRKETI